MLEILRIKNIAIIDSAEVRFKKGLNIISGETGAGKSIVIEAISLLLGSRASQELIRSGCEEAVIEGLFDISEIPWMSQRLLKCGFEIQAQELLIKRTVHRGGRHRISVNGELATLSTLQSLCEGLIDLCGQSEHQSLLKPAVQLELLDRFGGLFECSKNLCQFLNHFRVLLREQELLRKQDNERAKQADFLKFQIEEIRQARLQDREEENLLLEKQLLQSSAVRVQTSEAIRQFLESDDTGALNLLRIALQKLRSLALLDVQVQSISEALERALVETEEVALALDRYSGAIELDSEKLQQVQERLSNLADLRRKYGADIPKILKTLGRLETELASIGSVNQRLDQISQELRTHEHELKSQAKVLTTSRKKAAELFADSVTAELKDLKMGEARFLVEFLTKESLQEWATTGADSIHFLVQTNRGEQARPLAKIASGGELSRLMLAIRRVIADRGGIGVYLFDEIDAGIGGQTAFQVGKKLRSVASYNQVICITHLPQVASFADHHLVVHKIITGKRTVTDVRELSAQEVKEELARMLGGPDLTRKSLENAAELLELAHLEATL